MVQCNDYSGRCGALMAWLDMLDSEMERSSFGPWSGSLCCFWAKILSQCLSSPRSINGYSKENLKKLWRGRRGGGGVTSTRSNKSSNILSCFGSMLSRLNLTYNDYRKCYVCTFRQIEAIRHITYDNLQ